LRLVSRDALSIRRRKSGKGWSYLAAGNLPIRDEATIRRLSRLAVPPAYQEVLYASDPAAHLQAVGRDAAGRLQYRYHPEWEKVREIRKARRLERLASVLPCIRRSIGQHLGCEEFTPAFACSAVIELVARSAIRPGNEIYARQRGTRGAATLLKSNVRIKGSAITLTFRAKGGKSIVKEFNAPRLAAALERLAQLPGRRMFQCRGANEDIRPVTTRDVNAFLREIAGANISLKDFRTLLASASVLETLANAKPAATERQRRKQVMQAIRCAADELANTPAICRKSYVNTIVVEAFEDGVLERFAKALKSSRSANCRTGALAELLSKGAR
jgi:DNA topoisomerase-1